MSTSVNESSEELDLDQLMRAIKDAASRRFPDLAAYRQSKSPGADGPLAQATQMNYRTQLRLAPEFVRRTDDSYHVNDLLKYQDRDFVRNAYRAILRREPDEDGFRHKLALLQSGAFNKIDILASLRYSEEGKLNGVSISGLKLPAIIRTLERIPVVGYLFQTLIAFARLPSMIRSQREFQGYVVAQQLAIADHINETQRIVADDLGNLNEQLRTVETKALSRILDQEQRLQHAEVELQEMRDELEDQHRDLTELTVDLKTLVRNVATVDSKTTEEFHEWDDLYASFEAQFRGSHEEVEERLRFYLPFLKDLAQESEILDLGSGRGDWLELLGKEGFQGRGVELNEVLAKRAREKGLDVVNADIMAYLGKLPDRSLDLVTMFHLIEHFSVKKLIPLLAQIKRTLKPGGLLMIETPSPENLVVAACNFYADPTHHKPIYPQTLMFLLSSKGFVDLNLRFLHPAEHSPFEGESPELQQLHMWFFGPRDFSVIARKAH